MLRKVSRIGAVLEHVCKVWVPKVVAVEVMLRVSWRSVWRSLVGRLGGRFESLLGVMWAHLGGVKPVQFF